MVKIKSIVPLFDRVIVKPVEAMKQTAGGITLLSSSEEKQTVGKVIYVGEGKLNDDFQHVPLKVKENDYVMYAKYGGIDILIDGIEYVLLKESDIYGIVQIEEY